MNAFATKPPGFTPRPRSGWAEEHGGFVVAVAIGLLAYTWLVLTVYEPPQLADLRPRIKIRLAPEPPPVVQAPPLDVEVAELAATSVLPAQIDLVRNAVKAEDSQSPDDGPASISAWKPKSVEQAERLQAALSGVRNYKDELDRAETDVKGRLNRISVESAGRDFLINSDGGKQGIIRTLDVAAFPEEVVIPVLNRYGITVEYRRVTPGDNRSFLNAATTSGGTFTNVVSEGFYEVFVLSAKAVSMMASLETTALMERNFDPVTSRIRRIQFGIVSAPEGGYALGVTDLEVERLR